MVVSKKYIDKSIADQVISIGPEFSSPRGGIAQVVYHYNNYIFEDIKYISNSCEGSKVKKLLCAIKSIIIFCLYALLDRRLKIVHIHSGVNISFERSAIFVYLARFFRLKPIIHIHSGGIFDYYDKKPDFVKRVLYKCADVIVLGDLWIEFFNARMSLPKIEVLENIIPIPSTLNKSNFDDNKIHLLFLARAVKPKGIFELADALIDNIDKYKDKIVLHFGGTGDDLEAFMQKVENAEAQDIIKCEGWITGERKMFLLNHCDAFILPTYYEGISLSILEAMTYNMPILATNVGGNPSLVIDGVNGLLFKPQSSMAIAEVIDYVINNRDEVKAFGLASADIVSRYYPENVSNHLENIYRSLL